MSLIEGVKGGNLVESPYPPAANTNIEQPARPRLVWSNPEPPVTSPSSPSLMKEGARFGRAGRFFSPAGRVVQWGLGVFGSALFYLSLLTIKDCTSTEENTNDGEEDRSLPLPEGVKDRSTLAPRPFTADDLRLWALIYGDDYSGLLDLLGRMLPSLHRPEQFHTPFNRELASTSASSNASSFQSFQTGDYWDGIGTDEIAIRDIGRELGVSLQNIFSLALSERERCELLTTAATQVGLHLPRGFSNAPFFMAGKLLSNAVAHGKLGQLLQAIMDNVLEGTFPNMLFPEDKPRLFPRTRYYLEEAKGAGTQIKPEAYYAEELQYVRGLLSEFSGQLEDTVSGPFDSYAQMSSFLYGNRISFSTAFQTIHGLRHVRVRPAPALHEHVRGEIFRREGNLYLTVEAGDVYVDGRYYIGITSAVGVLVPPDAEIWLGAMDPMKGVLIKRREDRWQLSANPSYD